MMTLRAGQRHLSIPDFGVTTSRRAVQVAAAADWWTAGGAPTPLAAYQPKGAASLAASYTNLVTPGTYDTTTATAPTWDATNGWKFNGTDQYLENGITPNDGYAALVRFSNVTSDGDCSLFGAEAVAGGDRRFKIQPVRGGVVYYMYGGFLDVAPALTAGVLGMADHQGYRNGVANGSAVSAWSTPNESAMRIGGKKQGTSYDYIAAYIQAFVIWDTSTEHATWMPAVSAAMAAL